MCLYYINGSMNLLKLQLNKKLSCPNKQKSFLYLLAGAAGIEPALTVLETVALPLNYAPSSVYYFNKYPLGFQ